MHILQVAALKREMAELRHAYSSSRDAQRQGAAAWEAQHEAAQRVAQERDVALQEVGSLAHELESLQAALSSPTSRGPAPPPRGYGAPTPYL